MIISPTQLTKKLKLKAITFKGTVNSFENHNSVGKIKGYYKDDLSFEFKQFTTNELLNIIKELPSNKASVLNNIPTKMIKKSAQTYSSKETKSDFKSLYLYCKFSRSSQIADVTPVFKKGDAIDKENYRPISTLSNFSKIFEKLVYNQIFEFMNPKLSKYIIGFRKHHNTQHALLKMIENWRSKLNCGNKIGALIMDLPKAFDTINHDLFVSKLKAYGFNETSVSFIRSCLTNRYPARSVSEIRDGEDL